MEEPTIKFPVTCPQCGAEAIGEYSLAKVASALLTKDTPLVLTAPCHEDFRWNASDRELLQIREYFGAVLSSVSTQIDQSSRPQNI